MAVRIYKVTMVGTQPLVMHADDIDWADKMEDWKNDKENKKRSRAGDDRTPAFRWIGCLYHGTLRTGGRDRDVVMVPTENIMRALMEGGAGVPVPGAKGSKTFKAQSQSGIMPRDIGWPLEVASKLLDYAPIEKLMGEDDFARHREAVVPLGFELFLKRARIGTSKHIRVRPRFSDWSITGELSVSDDQITTGVLEDILEFAGKYKGLGDWRPSSKTPGIYGMFEASVEQIQ